MPDPEPCLADETIVAIVAGELTPISRSRAEHHIRRCAPCRELVELAVRSGLDVSELRRASRPALAS
jgi:anti-sigma factor RsiW